MSLILDALRKSDRQRNHSHTEQLRWGPGPARTSASGPHPATVLFLLLAVLLLVGASAWFGSWIASERKDAESGGKIMEDGIQDTRSTEAAPAEPVRSLQGELAAPAEPPRQLQSTTDTGPDRAAATAFEDIVLAPTLDEMPAEFREQLPTLAINVHAWTEKPNDRFVLINMRRYGEGDRLREGPLLRQVTPEGAVLEYRGEVFTLPQR